MEEVLNKAFERAKFYEMNYGGCPQCVLAGVFEALDIQNDHVFKAASGLADGVGLTGNGHCGALSGGTMAISYLFGRERADFPETRKMMKAFILSKKLMDWYVEKYGSCRCADVQTRLFGRFFNLYDPEELKAAAIAGVREKCSTLAGEVARIATKLILEERVRMGQ